MGMEVAGTYVVGSSDLISRERSIAQIESLVCCSVN
jgi:hypothetical protein